MKFVQPSSPSAEDRRRRGLLVRCSSCLLGLCMGALLLLAAHLEPSPHGMGTHQQLGFPPCTMRVIFQLRCPACGMTTSWAHFVRGQWASSMRVNLGGFLLALYGSGLLAMCTRISWTGSLPGERWQEWAAWALLAIAIVTIVDWAGRLIVERVL